MMCLMLLANVWYKNMLESDKTTYNNKSARSINCVCANIIAKTLQEISAWVAMIIIDIKVWIFFENNWRHWVDRLSHVLSNPLCEVADLCVDSRMEQSSASYPPADNSCQITGSISIVTHHGSSRVTLTTVLATLSSTDHAVSNTEGVLQPGKSDISWFTYNIFFGWNFASEPGVSRASLKRVIQNMLYQSKASLQIVLAQ